MEMQQVENKAKKDNTISVAKEISSFGISLIPLVGDGKDLQESISGLDLITGKKLSALERVLAGACVIVPVVSGSMVRIAGKNAEIAEKISLLSEKQLFKKVGKGIVMCEDAKKEMEQLIREVRNMLEEDADIKRLFAKNKNTGLQVEIAGVGKVSLEEAEKLVGKDVRWSRGESGSKSLLMSTPEEIANMTRKELQDSLPEGWDFQNHNGRIHIKDESGNYRVRIDPPDKKTNYTHIHIMDENKNPLDINGNIVSPKDLSGHIPYNN